MLTNQGMVLPLPDMRLVLEVIVAPILEKGQEHYLMATPILLWEVAQDEIIEHPMVYLWELIQGIITQQGLIILL